MGQYHEFCALNYKKLEFIDQSNKVELINQTIISFTIMPTYKQKKQKLRELVKKQEQQRIQKIKQEGHAFQDTDAFKRLQKHFKYYTYKQTDFTKVIKYQDLPSFDINGFKVYQLKQPSGVYLIKSFIDLQTQLQVGFQALNQYIFRPYRTNLDGTNGLDTQIKYEKSPNELNKNNNQDAQISQGKQINQGQKQQQKDEIDEKQNQKLLQGVNFQKQSQYYFNQKIRMANLGYQYDWPHRSYPATKVPIPLTIRKLTNSAKLLYEKVKKQQVQYHGEAIIVNYYKQKDYMTGHLDDGQEDQENPIFSFNFGLSCIFLIGYPQRNIQPVPILLQAGDLLSILKYYLVMSEYSRICYHGVPRIMQKSFIMPSQEEINKVKNKIDQKKGIKKYNGTQQILNYYRSHRININVRQVWIRKQNNLKDSEQKLY